MNPNKQQLREKVEEIVNRNIQKFFPKAKENLTNDLMSLIASERKESYKEGKERYNRLNRNWANKQLKLGKCRQCSSAAAKGRTRCQKHLDMNNEQIKLHKLLKLSTHIDKENK